LSLNIHQLRHAAQGVKLGPIDLSVESGQCVCLSAPSGSGKTLLLRAIADLDRAVGECSIDGTARSAMTAPQWRRQVAYVPAEPGWWATTALEHFQQPDLSRLQALDLGLDESCLERPIEMLSTGERLRLAMVRALELKPAVLLLDEPTGALDTEATRLVEVELHKRLKDGMALLMVTHDTAQIGRFGASAHTLKDGYLAPLEEGARVS
jgi:putative ABC transport system ATP-binding protein